MNVESPHLDLEELLAAINDKAAEDPARAHLATCPSCRAEADRWGTVASGVRHLVAATSAPAELPDHALAGARPPRQRRVLVAAAAAGIVVIGAASYGLTAGHGGSAGSAGSASGQPATTAAGLTAVSGCPGLNAASGTLTQVNGTSFVLKPPGSRPVTVTTSAATKLSGQVTGAPSDIADGERVIVMGTGSGPTLAARTVSLGVPLRLPRLPRLRKLRHGHPVRRGGTGGLAIGTVRRASSGGFNVAMVGGRVVPVTTSSSTTVYKLVTVSLSQLQTGRFTVAVGLARPNRTLAATSVAQGIHQMHPLPALRPSGRLGCSPQAVATTAFLRAG
jgi:hypothetical protein